METQSTTGAKKVQESLTESDSKRDFKDINILIGVPAHSGMLHHLFVSSLISTSQTLVNLGIKHRIEFVAGVSLVTLARNILANSLFEGGDSQGNEFTHLLMLDSDQGFEATDIVKMIVADKEIVALPTTLKGMDWGRIAQGAKHGASPNGLKRLGGLQNFDDLPGARYSTNELVVQVAKGGAALMLVRKSVFAKLAEANPTWKCRRSPTEKQNPNREWDYNFFQSVVDPESGYLLSEDWFLCREARKISIPVFIVPSAVTQHVGPFSYTWDATSIAELNMRNAAGVLK